MGIQLLGKHFHNSRSMPVSGHVLLSQTELVHASEGAWVGSVFLFDKCLKHISRLKKVSAFTSFEGLAGSSPSVVTLHASIVIVRIYVSYIFPALSLAMMFTFRFITTLWFIFIALICFGLLVSIST